MARLDVPVGGRVRKSRAVEDQSASIPGEKRASLDGTCISSDARRKGNLAIPFIGWIKVKKGSILSRLLKKFASKAAADESTGGVASGLR
jgi:hypothetical protein